MNQDYPQKNVGFKIPDGLRREQIELNESLIRAKTAEIQMRSDFRHEVQNDGVYMEAASIPAGYREAKQSANQDNFLLFQDPNHRFFCAGVFDGVGGASGGAEASRIFSECISNRLNYMAEQSQDPNVQLAPKDIFAAIEKGIREAREKVQEIRDSDIVMSAADTTITLTLGSYNPESSQYDVFFVNSGDTRAYLYEQNQLEQTTHDDSLTAELEAAGQLDPLAAKTHEHRNVILKSAMYGDINDGASSPNAEDFPTLAYFPYNITWRNALPGSAIVLASDGFTDQFREDGDFNEVKEFLARGLDAPSLVGAAVLRREQGVPSLSKDDDTTIVTVHLPLHGPVDKTADTAELKPPSLE